jgi:hypothetical protein
MNHISKLLLIIPAILMYGSCQVKVEKTGFDEPENPNPVSDTVWEKVEEDFHAAFGSIDKRYKHHLPPSHEPAETWNGSAWKGERKNVQLMLWSANPVENIQVKLLKLSGPNDRAISKEQIGIHPVRYVLTDEFLNGCGRRDKDTIPAHLAADILENNQTFNLEAKTLRPVWLTVDVPPETVPGSYKGVIQVSYKGGADKELPLNLDVLDLTLPSPEKWKFHLDLWQNPFAVARWHEVELWSDKHMELLKPYLEMLANAGQKCITTSILHRPWGGQTYDPFRSMIKWTHLGNGEWEYDYSIFDRWVELAMDAGITDQISCYSMVPWGNQVRYYDEDSSKYVTVGVKPGSQEYRNIWKPFLVHFREHLKEKGWLEKTAIAMDERGLEEMKSMVALLNEVSPEFSIALAGRYHKELTDDIDDLCVFIRPPLDKQIIRERKKKEQVTTFYTSCARPEHPNNFTFSPPAEQTWLGWHAAARGFSGYLRWAYISWVEDPLKDSRFRTWPAGDTYQVYPGPRSSIRFEMLRDGIEDYEKISIIRSMLVSGQENKDLTKLEESLSQFTVKNITKPNAAHWLNKGKKELENLSHQIK